MTVTIQTSPDGTTWRDAMAFPAITSVGKTYLFPGNLDQYIRASWAITGTDPSFTFALTGQGHVIYAERQDLIDLGIPASALSNVSLSAQYRALITASGVADVHLNRVFTLPLSEWGESLRRIVAAIAAFDLRKVKGFKPEGTDQLIKYSYEDSNLSLRMLEDKTKPPDIVDATPDTFDAGVIVHSSPSRGW
jgi:phage gp36-like protein